MENKKFNPIADLPPLPGETTKKDTVVNNVVMENPQAENGQKPVQPIQKEFVIPEPTIMAETENHRSVVIQGIILVSLIAIIFLGIIFTLRAVPQIISNISAWSKSPLTSATSTKATTFATLTQTTKKTAVSTTATSTSTTTTVNTSSTVQPAKVASRTPASLIAGMLTTRTIGNRTTVRFNIQNIGGTTSGTWSFAAHLPSTVTPTYYSQPQSPLTPLSGVFYTLEFTQDTYQYAPVKIDLFY